MNALGICAMADWNASGDAGMSGALRRGGDSSCSDRLDIVNVQSDANRCNGLVRTLN